MARDGEHWHLIEAKRDDGAPTMFRIRELAPRPELTTIFVVELPYPATEPSRLPDAPAYRRLAEFEEQWLAPACAAHGWELVGAKTEDGSCCFYLYGATAPQALIERLSPFEAALGFYDDDDDPAWAEYATLRELLELAHATPAPAPAAGQAEPRAAKRAQPRGKPRAKQPARPRAKPRAKSRPRSPAKPRR